MARKNKLKFTLDQLGYDFNHFELTHFIKHIENLRRREILVIGLPFALELSAAWVRAKTADYIFYNQNAHPVHQTHSILHEIAHIVLEHSCRTLDEVLPPTILAQLHTEAPVGRLRVAGTSLHMTPEEQEAEVFVLLIQQHLVAARRLTGLTGPSSSIKALQRWVDGMAFTE